MIHIAMQVCDALSAAHEAGIVHRDIKPDNVYLVRRSGDTNFVKVVDFGISKVYGAAAALEPSLTRTGAALGTPYYMAPEQVHGRKDIDCRTDVYALGVVVFLALTGRHPFDGETYPMLVMNIVTQPLPQLSAFRPDLPPELQDVLERMVAKDRESRFSTADEAKAALRPFANVEDRPSAALPAGPAPALPVESQVRAVVHPVPPRSHARIIAGVIGAIALAGALVGGALAVWSGEPAQPDDRASMPERVQQEEPRMEEVTPTAPLEVRGADSPALRDTPRTEGPSLPEQPSTESRAR